MYYPIMIQILSLINFTLQDFDGSLHYKYREFKMLDAVTDGLIILLNASNNNFLHEAINAIINICIEFSSNPFSLSDVVF